MESELLDFKMIPDVLQTIFQVLTRSFISIFETDISNQES